MGWRTVIVSGCAKLDYKIGYLVIRKQDSEKRVHLDDIDTLLVDSTASILSTFLISELSKKKINIIFCDEKHNPESRILPSYGSFDASGKLRRQLEWNKSACEQVWTAIVIEKIKQQAQHLSDINHQEEANMLFDYAKNVELFDATNREGHAAKVYFNALFGKEFTRNEDNTINAALNYGYSIILSCFTREITASGYSTMLGIFHNNATNPFNLASDFMEPFRILVDRTVVNLKLEKFESEEKRNLVLVLQNKVKIEGALNYIENAIKIYTQSLFDAIEDKDVSLIKFYKNEL